MSAIEPQSFTDFVTIAMDFILLHEREVITNTLSFFSSFLFSLSFPLTSAFLVVVVLVLWISADQYCSASTLTTITVA
jgi:hypothetical protein